MVEAELIHETIGPVVAVAVFSVVPDSDRHATSFSYFHMPIDILPTKHTKRIVITNRYIYNAVFHQ